MSNRQGGDDSKDELAQALPPNTARVMLAGGAFALQYGGALRARCGQRDKERDGPLTAAPGPHQFRNPNFAAYRA